MVGLGAGIINKNIYIGIWSWSVGGRKYVERGKKLDACWSAVGWRQVVESGQ